MLAPPVNDWRGASRNLAAALCQFTANRVPIRIIDDAQVRHVDPDPFAFVTQAVPPFPERPLANSSKIRRTTPACPSSISKSPLIGSSFAPMRWTL